MKISQLIVTVGISLVAVVGFGDIADAAPTVMCAQGVPTVVTDDSGVQHQSCVESAADVPPASAAPTSARASLVQQPTTATIPSQLPATGAGMGGLIIAALLVGSGSVASLLSRRKP